MTNIYHKNILDLWGQAFLSGRSAVGARPHQHAAKKAVKKVIKAVA
jgi:hypothetical protein